jgi:hypothetical protein
MRLVSTMCVARHDANGMGREECHDEDGKVG